MRKIFKATLFLIVAILFIQPVTVAGTNGDSEPKEGIVYKVEKTYTAPNDSSSDALDVVAEIYLLDNHDGWASQNILREEVKVGNKSITPLPSGNKDNRMMEVELGDIDAGDSKTIKVTQVVRVDAKQIQISTDKIGDEIPTRYQEYTESVEHLWQSDDDEIENKAEELTQGLDNYYAKALRILEWVQKHLTYNEQTSEHDAVWAYEMDLGDCTEYSNLFIALARAAGIPAKAVSGYLLTPKVLGSEGYNLMNAGHQWVIIYLPSSGWMSVDLTYGEGQFGELSNDHIIELVSDGSNWVSNNKLSTPSSFVTYKYKGTNPDIYLNASGSAERVVSVNSSISGGNKISDDGTWKFTVSVKNVGSQPVSNVNVRLETDSDNFEAPPAENLGMISPGSKENLSFDMTVEKSFENSQLTAIVEYEAGEYGSFKSIDSVSVSADISNSESGLPISLPVSPQVLVGLIGGIILAMIVIALRR